MRTKDFSTLDPKVEFKQVAATKFIVSPDPTNFVDAEHWRNLFTKAPRLLAVAEGVLTALSYPRGSEAQVRCLEEIGQDVRNLLE